MRWFAVLLLLEMLAACSHTSRRLSTIEERAPKDLACREEVRVALVSPYVIGAAGCGRKRFYPLAEPARPY